MKNLFLALVALALVSPDVNAQTAVNFNVNDCAGNNHDLFAELNAGKVIVIAWVMPCGGCIPASQTAYAIVESYALSNPGQVLMYVADDYGTAPCATINNWVIANNMPNVTTFSDTAVKMTDYGGVGMPKILVLGGGFNHTVYFNQNNIPADDSTGIKNAVDAALADVTGIHSAAEAPGTINIFPNPVNGFSVITVRVEQPAAATIEIFSELGELVSPASAVSLAQGENKIRLDTGRLPAGVYFCRISEEDRSYMQKFVVLQ